MSVNLFPIPKTVRQSAGTYDLSRARWIRIAPEACMRLKRRALDFARAIADAFVETPTVTAGEPAEGQTLVKIVLGTRARVGEQGYRLQTGAAGAVIEAGDEAGAFYGLETLRQLIEQHGAALPRVTIEDGPDFPQRGIMIDISRCKVPKMETLYQLVDRLARLKLNQIQLYTEHTFAFSRHESVWHDASPMTAEEILALDDYCRERYVQLVPNLNSFGHFERWLRHPEYIHLAECPDGFTWPWGAKSRYGSTLKPNRESLALLEELYAEFLPNFSSKLFNVGCDETWELGKGWSEKQCEKKGVTQVYLDFLLQIHKRVKKHGRTMMFWGDIILHEPKLIKKLPGDIVAKVWGYQANHPFGKECAHFARAGVPFYVCPGTSAWNSLVGCLPNALANLENAAKNGLKHGAIGYLVTDWGDGGHHQYLPISYPGYAAGAGMSWQYRKNRAPDLPAVLDRFFYHDGAGVMGKATCEAAKVQALTPAVWGNHSLFNRLFFWDMKNPSLKEMFAKLTRTHLQKCAKRFDEIEAMLPAGRPAAGDGLLAKAELKNALAMARHGVHRGLASLQRKADAAALRHEVQRIVEWHEELWLARNRPGGLRESSSRIRNLIEA